MKYSGFIDGLLLEAIHAKRTGDVTGFYQMMKRTQDEICLELIDRVNNPEFITQARRDSYWMSEQKDILERMALDRIEDAEVAAAPPPMRKKKRKQHEEQENQDMSGFPSGAGGMMPNSFFAEDDDDESGAPFSLENEDGQNAEPGDMDYAEEGDQENNQSGKESNPAEDKQKKQKKNKEAIREMEDAMNNFARMPEEEEAEDIPSFGMGRGAEQTREIEARMLSKIPPSIKRLARMIGRTGGMEWMEGKGFSKASKSDITGITVGDDLNSLLPSEIAMLSGQGTQDIFYKNFAEKRLQVFASASSGMSKKDHQDGPVIICLDTSSSMNGDPVTVAKALTLAVTIYALRRKRKVLIIKYSETHKYDSFMKMSKCRKRLMQFLRWTGSGGNDENSMFTDLFKNILPQEGKWDTADILCISDFGWARLTKDVAEMIEKAKASGMKFYGLTVSSYLYAYAADALNICDSKWRWEHGECVNIEK